MDDWKFFFRVSFCLDNKKIWRRELAKMENTQTLCLLIRVKHARRLSFRKACNVICVLLLLQKTPHSFIQYKIDDNISTSCSWDIYVFLLTIFSFFSAFVFEKCTATRDWLIIKPILILHNKSLIFFLNFILKNFRNLQNFIFKSLNAIRWCSYSSPTSARTLWFFAKIVLSFSDAWFFDLV